MIINKIKQLSFGYNKEYHIKLHEDLSKRKQYKQNANEFIKADKSLLTLEDDIVELEKSSKNTKSDKYARLTDYLIDSKQVLAYHLVSTFGSIKYCDNLIEHYLKEIEGLKDENAIAWRIKLCQGLAAFTRKDYSAQLGINKQKDEQQKPQEAKNSEQMSDVGKTLKEVADQAIDNYISDKGNAMLSLFEPLPSSPKGFCDVVGMEKEKRELKESIVDYVKNPQQAKLDEEEYGIKAPKGYLFYGPPGCGKTFIVEALASEAEINMFKMDVSKIGSKYVNQTSNNIQSAFDYLEVVSKKNQAPVLLFMDEVDSLARNRTGGAGESGEDLKTTATILKLMQDARDKGIIIIAATNKYDLLDDAFISRFDGQMYFGLPDEKQIKSLLVNSLSKRTKGLSLAQDEKEIESLSKDLQGYSNRSIVFLVDNAAKIAKRRNRADITSSDIREAIKTSDFKKVKEGNFKKENSKICVIGFKS